MGGDPLDLAAQWFALSACDALLLLFGCGHAHGGQGFGVAGHVAVQAQGQLLRVARVVVDAGVPLVQADGLHDHVVHAQRDEFPVQAVAEGAGLVATVHGVGQRELGLEPRAELGPGETLGRLRRAVVQEAHDDNGVGVDVQAQLDELMWFARDLLRANLGAVEFLLVHTVGGRSALVLARQQLMSSLQL